MGQIKVGFRRLATGQLRTCTARFYSYEPLTDAPASSSANQTAPHQTGRASLTSASAVIGQSRFFRPVEPLAGKKGGFATSQSMMPSGRSWHRQLCAQPESEAGADGETRRRVPPKAARPPPLAEHALCRQTPKIGAECPNWSRSDLCGGLSAMGVPTASW